MTESPRWTELIPPAGGLESLRNKRAHQERGANLLTLASAAVVLVAVAVALMPMRGADLSAVRQHFLGEPQPSFAIADQPAAVTQNVEHPGLRIYVIDSAATQSH